MSTTSLETLDLLKWRLERIEFALHGESGTSHDVKSSGHATLVDRVRKLEDRLAELCSKSPAAQELLRLRAERPQLFDTLPQDGELPRTAFMNKLPIVLSSAPEYLTTLSRLTSLQDNAMPEPSHLSSLIELRPDLTRVLGVQQRQEGEIEDLRVWSASLLAQWYESEVVRGNEQWAEWEERLSRVEQAVRRQESAKERDEVQAA